MMKRILLLLLLLAGCASQEPKTTRKKEQCFRMNLHSEMSSLDPRLVRDIPSVTSAKMLFEGLMRMSDQGPLFATAETVTLSEDKLTYTFKLRPTYWSDQTLVTAQDFEYSWKSVLSPHFPAEFAHQLFVLKNGREVKKGLLPVESLGVRALSHDLLEVNLAHPNPYFLELVAFPLTFPVKQSLAKQQPAWSSLQGDNFICNGPFALHHWRHHSELVLLRNPNYWDCDVVQLDKIILTMIEDEHTELNMYENGELDWAGSPNSSIPPEALQTLKCHRAEELKILPLAGTYCYKFNIEREPFTSAKMRRAFSLAIQRGALIDNILQANQIVAEALIPPCMRPKESCHKGESSSTRRAQQLFEEGLQELGYTRETLPPVTLIFSRSEKHQKMAQAIQQQWNAAFGIKVALQSYEWNSFIERLHSHEYQVGGRGLISDLSDPLSMLTLGSDDDTLWKNERFQELLQGAAATAELTKRFALLEEAERIILDEHPIAPLYHSTACYLQKPHVKGVYLSKLCDLDFKYAYIE